MLMQPRIFLAHGVSCNSKLVKLTPAWARHIYVKHKLGRHASSALGALAPSPPCIPLANAYAALAEGGPVADAASSRAMQLGSSWPRGLLQLRALYGSHPDCEVLGRWKTVVQVVCGAKAQTSRFKNAVIQLRQQAKSRAKETVEPHMHLVSGLWLLSRSAL